MNELKLSVEDVKQGLVRYYGKQWLFKCLQGAHWFNTYKASRIHIDGIEINIFEANNVIRMGLWYSRTLHIDTYIGHPDAIDIEISRLFEQLHDKTNIE